MVLDEQTNNIETVTVLDQGSGLTGDNVNAVYQDIEGNFGSVFGDGLSLMKSEAFSYFSGETPDKKT